MSVSKDCSRSQATSTGSESSDSHAIVLSRSSHMTTRGQANTADALGDPGRQMASHPTW